MSRLILGDLRRKIEKYIPKSINGAEIAFFLGFDNSIDGNPVIRIEIKLCNIPYIKSTGRSYCIIPFDKNLAEHEGYDEYISEKIEYIVKEMIFGTIKFLNESDKKIDADNWNTEK